MKILCIDDEEDWRDILRRALRDHAVDVAGTVEEALRLLGLSERDPYDVALVDLNLLGHDDQQGGEVLDVLRADHPRTKRIIFTATPPRGSVKKNLFERYGVSEVIIKAEVYLPDLRRAVDAAVGEDRAEENEELRRRRFDVLERHYMKRRDLTDRAERAVASAIEYSEAARHVGKAGEQARTSLTEARQRRDHVAEVLAGLRERIETCDSIDDLLHLDEQINRLDAELS